MKVKNIIYVNINDFNKQRKLFCFRNIQDSFEARQTSPDGTTSIPIPQCQLQILAGSSALEERGVEELVVGQVATLVFSVDGHSM